MSRALPLIFDIHRFALDDGPGIRTTVFMKGCPLSCSWCHNPESIRPEPEIAVYPDKCIQCGDCGSVCPQAAVSGTPVLRIDRERCTICGRCADICPALAIRKMGRAYPLEELLELLLADRHLFDASGGGVTFSGGEPTRRMDYLGAALQSLKSERIHTAIQTCGMFDHDRFAQEILPNVDLIMFDIKFIDTALHRRYTGMENSAILGNFRRLAREAGDRLLPRVPLIPGMTATPANLLAIASFLAELGCRRCDLLPYNSAVVEKRRAIGMPLPKAMPETPLTAKEEETMRRLFRERLLNPIDAAA